MSAMIRLFLAVAVASGVPGIVVYFAQPLLSGDPGQVAGYLLTAPFFLPVAIAFSATHSVLPAAGLGLALMALSYFWGGARFRMTWVTAGLVTGFFLVSKVSAATNPFADLSGACVAAACGGASMLVFHFMIGPQRFGGPFIAVRNLFSVLIIIVVLAFVGVAVGHAYSRRHLFAVPDRFRLIEPVGAPELATLFSYHEPEVRAWESTWQTDGRSITLRTGLSAINRSDQIVDRSTIGFSAAEIAAFGADPAEFKRTIRHKIDEHRSDIDVMIEIDRDGDQRKMGRPWRTLTERPLARDEHSATDTKCAIAWRWSGTEPPEAFGAPISHDRYHATHTGVAMTDSPLEATRFDCPNRICRVSFPYRNVVASFWIEPRSACNWRRQRQAVKEGLESRLVKITPAN